jgi:hypothetical protein
MHPARGRLLLSSVTAMIAAAGLAACDGAPATPTPMPAAIAWERVDPVAGSPDGPGRIVDVGGRLIGVGTGSPWVSEDGRTWTEGEVDGPPGSSVSAVAAGPPDGPELVGVGRAGPMGSNRPIAFTSADGRRWVAVEGQPAFGLVPGYEQAYLDLTAVGQAGVVAVGTEWGTAGQRPFALVSTDGRGWERTAEPPAGSAASALVATGAGFLLAGATGSPAAFQPDCAFWVSKDGRSWQAAPDTPTFANAEPRALAVGREVIAAVGFRILIFEGGELEGGFAPAAWTSTDGQSWVAAAETPGLAWWPAGRPTPAPGAIEGTTMETVASLGDAFIALGVRWGINPVAVPSPNGQSRITSQGVAWRSADGVSWEMLPDDPVLPLGTSEGTIGAGLYSVVARDDSVIAVGGTEADGVFVYIGTLGFAPRP